VRDRIGTPHVSERTTRNHLWLDCWPLILLGGGRVLPGPPL